MSRSLLCSLLFAVCATTACAPAPAASLVDIHVIDRDSGGTLPQYRQRSHAWIAGVPGHRYAVRLVNTSGQRVLVVLSVDGINAVSGEDASPSQRGYVLEPWQSTEVAGWRKSLEDIAQFQFTSLPDSYAARTGRPDNVGVIGVAVFREAVRGPAFIARAEQRSVGAGADSASEAPAAAPAPGQREMARAQPSAKRIDQQRIGTGHGAREWSPVSSTTFERASSQPDQVLQLRYDTPSRLMALGIVPRPPRTVRGQQAPQAFPGSFVADPPPRW